MEKTRYGSKKFCNEPIISVVMASYNHEKYIDDAINSVISQRIKDLEVIVVDDFSMDKSRDIIKEWVDKDSRVRAIFHDRNEGIARTVNDGIRVARGKYIALMASDDMFRQGAFEKIIAVLESSEDCGVALLEGECIDHRNRKVGLLFSERYRRPSKEKGSFFKDLVVGNFVCTGVVRKSVLKKYQISYNEELKYLNDWLFWLDLSSVCDFVFINEPLYYYRIHGANTSLKNYRNIMEDTSKAIDMVLSKYGKSLDNESRGKILREKGFYCISLNNYKEAREYLRQCLHLKPSPLSDVKTTMQILFTYFPPLFGYYGNLREKLKKRAYMEKKMLNAILR
ncbi:MAG: glycosyltransferase family 2 protein [Candidatus Bathyarchaeia archaeon]